MQIATWRLLWRIFRSQHRDITLSCDMANVGAYEVQDIYQRINNTEPSYQDRYENSNEDADEILWDNAQRRLFPLYMSLPALKRQSLDSKEILLGVLNATKSVHTTLLNMFTSTDNSNVKVDLHLIFYLLLAFVPESMRSYKNLPQVIRDYYLYQVYVMLNEYDSEALHQCHLFWDLVAESGDSFFEREFVDWYGTFLYLNVNISSDLVAIMSKYDGHRFKIDPIKMNNVLSVWYLCVRRVLFTSSFQKHISHYKSW